MTTTMMLPTTKSTQNVPLEWAHCATGGVQEGGGSTGPGAVTCLILLLIDMISTRSIQQRKTKANSSRKRQRKRQRKKERIERGRERRGIGKT